MARKRPTLTDLLNDETYKTIYEKFKLIAINAFEWSGLPEGLEERHIERNLFNFGKCLFVDDKDYGFLALECVEGGQRNIYNDPLSWRGVGFRHNEVYPADGCVIIENNKLRIPTKDIITLYAYKLSEVERTMDVNVKAVKTPVIFTCDETDVLTFKRIFQQVDGNIPAIFADKRMNPDSINVFNTGATFLGNELMDYSNSVENKLLTFLGVNNSPVDKKERLITDEANANNELISSFADLQLEARERACEAINSMYGLNVSVKRRCNVEKSVENVENPEDNTDV